MVPDSWKEAITFVIFVVKVIKKAGSGNREVVRGKWDAKVVIRNFCAVSITVILLSLNLFSL